MPPGATGCGEGWSQARPAQPEAHSHTEPPPATARQSPLPEQSNGHGSERRQFTPEKPGRHSHTPPSRQTPAPAQSSMQAEKVPGVLVTPEQSRPVEPAAQRQTPYAQTP